MTMEKDLRKTNGKAMALVTDLCSGDQIMFASECWKELRWCELEKCDCES